jgi:hypothetical protein
MKLLTFVESIEDCHQITLAYLMLVLILSNIVLGVDFADNLHGVDVLNVVRYIQNLVLILKPNVNITRKIHFLWRAHNQCRFLLCRT